MDSSVIGSVRQTPKIKLNEPLIMKDKNDDSRSTKIRRSHGFFKRILEWIFDHPAEFQTVAPFKHHYFPISKSFIQVFKEIAKKISSNSEDFLLFSLINEAYLSLTLNWLCNVATYKSRIHSKTLIVSVDKKTCDTIVANWPTVSCLYLNASSKYNSAFDWSEQGYRNLLNIRLNLLNILTKLSIQFILFESDSVWLRDPMQYFGEQNLIDDADIVVPLKGYLERDQKYTFDPMIVYPTNGSIILMNEMMKRVRNDQNLYDQDALDELCRTQFNGVVCRLFEWENIADGKWFHLSDYERNFVHPYIVNNNYYVGVLNKINRQALNGFWFLTRKDLCAISKVEKMLRTHSKNIENERTDKKSQKLNK